MARLGQDTGPNLAKGRNRVESKSDLQVKPGSGQHKEKEGKEKSVGDKRGAGIAILEGYTQTTFDAMMSWQTLQRGDGRGMIGSQGDRGQRNVDFRYLSREHVGMRCMYSGCIWTKIGLAATSQVVFASYIYGK